MPYKDEKQRKLCWKRSYEKHKEAKRQRAAKARKRNWEFLWDYKASRGCLRCQMRDPRTLDFHHVGPKTIDVAKAAGLGWSIERLMTEIAQCIVLCANCHRIETFLQRGRAAR